MKTNFDKVKEEMRIEDIINSKVCEKIKEMRDIKYCCMSCAECARWLAQEYEEPILDDIEKEYLSAVIKPFKNRVRGIVKEGDELDKLGEYIRINLYGNEWINLPYFKKGTMYKGMKRNKKYSLKDLELE